MALNQSFYLGRAAVNPLRCVIQIDEKDKHIEPQVMGVLVHLAAQPGEVITREQLLQAAWPNTIVNDGALSKAVSVLRKVLGDNPKKPQYIETIPKVGYRIVASVRYIDKPSTLVQKTTLFKADYPEKRLRSSSFLNLRLKELTVAQFLVLFLVVGLFLFLWPLRTGVPQNGMQLEKEVTMITLEEEEFIRVDSLWNSTLQEASVIRDTLVFKEVRGE